MIHIQSIGIIHRLACRVLFQGHGARYFQEGQRAYPHGGGLTYGSYSFGGGIPTVGVGCGAFLSGGGVGSSECVYTFSFGAYSSASPGMEHYGGVHIYRDTPCFRFVFGASSGGGGVGALAVPHRPRPRGEVLHLGEATRARGGRRREGEVGHGELVPRGDDALVVRDSVDDQSECGDGSDERRKGHHRSDAKNPLRNPLLRLRRETTFRLLGRVSLPLHIDVVGDNALPLNRHLPLHIDALWI